MSGEAANINGSAPATSATARILRFPTSCVLNLPLRACALPITPTTGLVISRLLRSLQKNLPILGHFGARTKRLSGSSEQNFSGRQYPGLFQDRRLAGVRPGALQQEDHQRDADARADVADQAVERRARKAANTR